jgi:hypothetical protein
MDMNVVAVDCLTEPCQHPIDQLAKCVGFKLTTSVTSQNFDQTLKAMEEHAMAERMHVVLLMDEYHASYAHGHKHLADWRKLCYRIPSYCHVTAVVTGSSAYLRSLAFGHATPPSVKFPGYQSTAMNLNSERYIAYTFDPLESTPGSNTISLTSKVRKALTPADLTDAEARLVFLSTGANMGQLVRLAYEADPFAISRIVEPYFCGDKFDVWSELLNLLAEAIETHIVEDVDADEELLRLVAMCPVRVVDPKNILSPKMLYEAADAGAIRYDDVRKRIGFASPLVAAGIIQQREVHGSTLLNLIAKLPDRLARSLYRRERSYSQDQALAVLYKALWKGR